MASTPLKVTTRSTYLSAGIPSPSALAPSPLTQFHAWFAHAQSSGVHEPEAMSLSTVSAAGIPSTRILLLKRLDPTGFVFFTNYNSRKGTELFPNSTGQAGEQGGYASLAWYWPSLHISVRVVGRAEKVSAEETREYFHSRPIGSQVGAWASEQSAVLESREELEQRVRDVEKRFGVSPGGAASAVDVGPEAAPVADRAQATAAGEAVDKIPVPPFWGGVRVVPFEVEFWAGRESRLHDRMRYTRPEGAADDAWECVRLSP